MRLGPVGHLWFQPVSAPTWGAVFRVLAQLEGAPRHFDEVVEGLAKNLDNTPAGQSTSKSVAGVTSEGANAAKAKCSNAANGSSWTPPAGWRRPAEEKGRFPGDVGDSVFTLSDDAVDAAGVPRGTQIPWRNGTPDFGAHAVPGPNGAPGVFSVAGSTGSHGMIQDTHPLRKALRTCL